MEYKRTHGRIVSAEIALFPCHAHACDLFVIKPTKMEKEPIRHLYEMYNDVKSLLGIYEKSSLDSNVSTFVQVTR